jgi:hypothetical protein
MRREDKRRNARPRPVTYGQAVRDDKRKGRPAGFGMLRSPAVFWIAVWLALFGYLQVYGRFHFLYLDQEHLFLHDRSYFLSLVARPAGLVEYLNTYLTQFFILPYCGAVMMGFLLTLASMLTAWLVRRTAPRANLAVCCLVPAVAMLFLMFNVNFYYSGILAYVLMLAAFCFYAMAERTAVRIVYMLAVSATLFWLAGAVAFLFVLCIFVMELMRRPSQAYLFLMPVVFVVGLSVWSVQNAWAGEYRFLLLPDGYYTRRLHPEGVIYFAWIALPVLLVMAFVLRNRDAVKSARKWVERTVQLAVVGAFFAFGLKNYVNMKAERFNELDYYVRTGEWNEVVARCNGNLNNYLHKCYLNLSLAETGELSNRMFAFDQNSTRGLLLPKNRVTHISVMLSDIFFSMGHVALAQQMAFEANVSTQGNGSPRMYKRLVETNLIMGAYAVAEKYIALLEKTWYYKPWATEQRRFLWDDQAVASDSVLGMKRKCVVRENSFAEINGLDDDLKRIARQNPVHTATVQYLGALYLLDKDLEAFRDFVEAAYGSDFLPVLPKSFQEAVIILAEQEPEYWAKFNISESVIRRYTDFRQQVLANRSSASALPALLYRSYGDTYWHYYMFKNTN